MTAPTKEFFDVVIVGAGLSGIGAACHLTRECPRKSFVVLESRATMGGTWDLFRYPGIRSDSDMYTLGYKFKPWKNAKSIADGPSILAYIRETAADYDLGHKIRYNQRVIHANWSSDTAQWTVEIQHGATGQTSMIACGFLLLCSGYYNYDAGYLPDFPGADQFKGTVIHPQKWPENFDYTGKRVVVIGSGATAVTLVPAMADKAQHVTMLQRSPTYMVALPSADRIANAMRNFLPLKMVYWLTRWRNTLTSILIYQMSQRKPELVKGIIKKRLIKELGADYDVDKHFTPPYNPWDQRMCLVQDGDLFKAIRAKRADIVTDQIESFTPTGIRLKSGEQLEADVIVTATGLNLLSLGGIKLQINGAMADISQTLTYKGTMLSGLPNIAFVIGYTNASWTLKADLVCAYLCRLLNFMDKHGYRQVTPHLNDPEIHGMPLLNLTAGYITRAIHQFPQQGSKLPWRLYQNYIFDMLMFRFGSVKDDALEFKRASAPAKVGDAALAA